MAERYEVRTNLDGVGATRLVVDRETGRALGGFGSNYHRSWVYPLYAPNGATVLREFPFDHPFHTGAFVGQNPVRVAGREANYWALPVPRGAEDKIMVRIGRMDPQAPVVVHCDSTGARMSLRAIWRDENDQPLLDEIRTVLFRATPDATICEMTCELTANYGAAELPRTKYGTMGFRADERLLQALGGEIVAVADGGLRRGGPDVAHERECDLVAYENEPPGLSRYGVALQIMQNSASPERTGPWFVRDYGLMLFNPAMREGLTIDEGDTWSGTVRVVAYDGALTPGRADGWDATPSNG